MCVQININTDSGRTDGWMDGWIYGWMDFSLYGENCFLHPCTLKAT